MTFKAKLRLGLRTVLLLSFLTLFGFAIFNLAYQPTSMSFEYEKSAFKLPSFTVCPVFLIGSKQDLALRLESNRTLMELMDTIESVNDNLLILDVMYGNDEFELANLSNAKKFPASTKPFNEWITFGSHGKFIKCGTWHPPQIDAQYISLMFQFNMTNLKSLFVEKHEKQQSRVSYFYQTQWDHFTTLARNNMIDAIVTSTKYVAVSTNRYDCDQKNGQKIQDCLTQFVIDKLDCQLPWIQNKTNTRRPCNTLGDKSNFVKVEKSLAKSKAEQELITRGCLRPNCEFFTWLDRMDSPRDFKSSPFYKENSTVYILHMQRNISQKSIRQTVIYGISQFIADFGGYLGLLLGASILSIYDTIVGFIVSKFSSRPKSAFVSEI